MCVYELGNGEEAAGLVINCVREILVIGLISELCAGLAYSAKTRKYINFVSGIMIICVCLKMFGTATNLGTGGSGSSSLKYQGSITSNLELLKIADLYGTATYTTTDTTSDTSYDIKNSNSNKNSATPSLYLTSYVESNKSYIESATTEFGLVAKNVTISMEEYEISSIEVVVTGSADIEKCMELKRFLTDIYEVDSSCIKVVWKK